MKFTQQNKSLRETLLTATVRDFTGGWDILDNDLNLSSKYAIKLFNAYVAADGTITIRYGTRLFVDLSSYMSSAAELINMEYYQSALICVCSNGDIISIDGTGAATRIWDAAIAATLPGAPAGWSTTSFASFAQFNGELIVCNGVDKPLIINTALSVDYLQDLATLTNINTPIASYVTVCNRYVVMAGDPANPDTIHISSRDASGTWQGDPAPNDGTQLDVGSYLPNSSIITGIGEFKGQLIVTYPEGSLVFNLGIYDGTDHKPEIDRTVSQYGNISHRTMQSYGDDMLLMDTVGVPTLKRSVFSGTLKPDRVSELVDPEIHERLVPLSLTSLTERCWSVYNQREGQFLFFVPDTDSYSTTTTTTAYVFNFQPTLNVKAWARFDGWNFVCGASTLQKNVFFGDRAGKIWLYGNELDEIYSDYEDDVTINSGDGTPITFDWELPWTDINKRARTKQTKYLELDTKGTATFNISMYADRRVSTATIEDVPALTGDFVGGDSGGFGSGYTPYGGGRNTSYNKLWSWPAKFKLMKLRFRGQTTEKLKFVAITLYYLKGSIYR